MKGSPMQQQVAMDAASGLRDCVHFVRTGTCRYGPNCRFNHPGQGLDSMQATYYPPQIPEFPERIGQPDCQFYLKTGTCKFGAQCKYHHPNVKAGSARGPPLLNFVGLPMRPGEKECAFYLRTGSCKFGVACKFHHPDPAGIGVGRSPSYPSNAPLSPAPIPTWRPVYFPASGLPGSSPYMAMYPSSPQSIPFNGGWASYQGMSAPLANGDHRGFFNGAQQQAVASMRPPFDRSLSNTPRTEQQDCQYYVQTGHCKFGASCKYQHPTSMSIPMIPTTLSPMGLPLRPVRIPILLCMPSFLSSWCDDDICAVDVKQGQPFCTFYLRNGICKFGPVCRYDHPIRGLSVASPPPLSKEIVRVEEEPTLPSKNFNGNDGSGELVDGLQDSHDSNTEKIGD